MTALLAWEDPNRTWIAKLRVHGAMSEASPLHLALSGAIGRADLRPPGLPPAAVLIVRRMADPLPGRFPRRPRVNPSAAWERAARDQLAGLYRRAARPGHGAAAPGAEAVVFADEGELLASLALDVASGRMRERWWWRSLSGSFLPAAPRSLAHLLGDRATSAPAALALLARQNRAVDLVRALTPSEATRVLTAVCTAHGLSSVAAIVASPRASSDRSEAAPRTVSLGEADDKDGAEPLPGTGARPEDATPRRARRLSPPWAKWVASGAVPAELDEARACLLGVALALHDRPEAVRSAAFALELQHWRSGQSSARPRPGASAGVARASDALAMSASPTAEPPPPRPTAGRGSHAEVGSPLKPVAKMAPPKSGALSAESAPSPAAANRPEAPARSAPAAARSVDGGATSPAAAASPVAAADPPAKRDPAPPSAERRSPAGEETRPAGLAPAAAEAAQAAARRIAPATADVDATGAPSELESSGQGLSLEGGVDTALGGVMFLINAMCALDLPERFEAGWRLASSLGAWSVLEILGRTLLASDRDCLGDSIWPAIAALSKRGGERLGLHMPRRAAYRLPAAWGAQMPAEDSEPAAWAAHGRRLRLWSRGSYVLSDRGFAGSLAAQARAEARRHGCAHAPARAPFGDAPLAALPEPPPVLSPALARWLSLVVPFVRRRLARSLGVEPDPERLAQALLRRRGRLYVTSTHVDLVMPLNAVSVPVRLSGLDRDPGWLPAFGRVILFHFEE
ncbi:hypothetical protein [Rhodoblastus sp.]|uniref:hypothetical protein n=1 Tax=Rhodoblastus sp. TaxID=1962975 RepID=UPI003F98797E